MNMNIKVTITRAENGFVAEHGGLMYVGSTPLEAIRGTATHFILKKYKDHGIIMDAENKDERMKVTP